MKNIKYLFLFSIFLIIMSCSNLNVNSTNYIRLYYVNNAATDWITEDKELPANPEVIIKELIVNKNTYIPKDTKLLSLEVKENVAYVNLSKEFEDNSNGDFVIWSNIYTIVNTLCLNKSLDIDSVQFLIEGEIRKAIGPMSGDVLYNPRQDI